MYKRFTHHILVCGEKGLLFDKISVKNELTLAQIPLISGGYYSKVIGTKWCEITVEGSISQDERQHYDRFIAAASGSPVELTADITTYYGCVLVENEVTSLPDSRIDRFRLKFRSVGNG